MKIDFFNTTLLIISLIMVIAMLLFAYNHSVHSNLVDSYCKEHFNSKGWDVLGCEIGFDHNTGNVKIYYFSEQELEEILK